MGDTEFLAGLDQPKPFHYISPDGTTFIPPPGLATGAMMWATKMADVLRRLPPGPRRRGPALLRHERSGAEAWSFTVGPDGTSLIRNYSPTKARGGSRLMARATVYLAAGQIQVFDPAASGSAPSRSRSAQTCLVFGGQDHSTSSSLQGPRCTAFGPRPFE